MLLIRYNLTKYYFRLYVLGFIYLLIFVCLNTATASLGCAGECPSEFSKKIADTLVYHGWHTQEAQRFASVSCKWLLIRQAQGDAAFADTMRPLSALGKNERALQFVGYYPEAATLLAHQPYLEEFLDRIEIPNEGGVDETTRTRQQRLLLSVMAMENRPIALASFAKAISNARNRKAVIKLAEIGLADLAQLFFYEPRPPEVSGPYDEWLSRTVLEEDPTKNVCVDRILSITLFHGAKIRKLLAENEWFRANFMVLMRRLSGLIAKREDVWRSFFDNQRAWDLIAVPGGFEIFDRWGTAAAVALYGAEGRPDIPFYSRELRPTIIDFLTDEAKTSLGAIAIILHGELSFHDIIRKGLSNSDLECVGTKILTLGEDGRLTPNLKALKWQQSLSADTIQRQCGAGESSFENIPIKVLRPGLRIAESEMDGRGSKFDNWLDLGHDVCDLGRDATIYFEKTRAGKYVRLLKVAKFISHECVRVTTLVTTYRKYAPKPEKPYDNPALQEAANNNSNTVALSGDAAIVANSAALTAQRVIADHRDAYMSIRELGLTIDIANNIEKTSSILDNTPTRIKKYLWSPFILPIICDIDINDYSLSEEFKMTTKDFFHQSLFRFITHAAQSKFEEQNIDQGRGEMLSIWQAHLAFWWELGSLDRGN